MLGYRAAINAVSHQKSSAFYEHFDYARVDTAMMLFKRGAQFKIQIEWLHALSLIRSAWNFQSSSRNAQCSPPPLLWQSAPAMSHFSGRA